LESGDIDYAFEYKSVALQRNLHFLEFPPEINLGSDDFKSLGYDLRVKIDYQRFASLIPDFVARRFSTASPYQKTAHTQRRRLTT
jgi:hypothetical protein